MEHWQRLMDGLRERPWISMVALWMMVAAIGWMRYTGEVEEHKADLKAANANNVRWLQVFKSSTDKTISAQCITIATQQKLLEITNRKDTTK